ncbi:MAG: hypothetical protein P4L69_02410 [Desulfosporosinus sp.]|nr:hypothetical protein [Desulfosporosinus sp.]
MEEVRKEAKSREKRGCKQKKQQDGEPQNQPTYCSECYFQDSRASHNRASPISASDEAEKQIEKCFKGKDNEGEMRLNELEKMAEKTSQESKELLKEASETTEKKKNEIKRMMYEMETFETDAIRCDGQLHKNVIAAKFDYDHEKERMKRELGGTKDCNEAEAISTRIKNDINAMLSSKCDAIQRAIRKCEEANGKLKRANREIPMITRDNDTIVRMIATQNEVLINKQLEEFKSKTERRIREILYQVGKCSNNVIIRRQTARAEREREKMKLCNTITGLSESNKAIVNNLKGQITKMENELRQKNHDIEGRDRKLASLLEESQRLKRDNEWLIDSAERVRSEGLPKFKDMIREMIVENERYAETPTIASSTYTHYYPSGGGGMVYLYNTKTGEASTLTFDCDQPGVRSSTIIVGNNLYIIGGEGPSSAVYSMPIVYGIQKCKAIKKEKLNVARSCLALSQYARKYIYALGGYTDDSVKCCEKYDIGKDGWSKLKDLNEARCNHSACVITEFIYVIGGSTNEAELKSIERMNIFKEEEGWEKVSIRNEDKMWTARYGCAVCKIYQNQVIVFGGCYNNDELKSECYIMDAVEKEAVSLPISLPEADSFHRLTNCVIRKGKLYSISANKNLYVCDLNFKKWEEREVPWKS